MHILGSIWTNPRSAFKELLTNQSFLVPFILLYLGSVGVGLLTLFNSEGMGSADLPPELAAETFTIPLWFTMIITLVISPVFYLISTVIYSFFTMLFGKWLFKGTGKFKDLLKVNSSAYSAFVPAIPIIGLWLIFNSDSLLNSQNTGIIGLIVIILLALITFIYYFIFNLVGISEAHQFSKWKAFFTMLIPMIIFFILFFIIIAVIALILVALFAGLAGAAV